MQYNLDLFVELGTKVIHRENSPHRKKFKMAQKDCKHII